MSREEGLAQSNLDVREVDREEGGGDRGEGEVSQKTLKLNLSGQCLKDLPFRQTLTYLLLGGR